MKIGFIGLGNVGSKLSGSLIRNGHDVAVHDLNADFVAEKVAAGARDGQSPAALMQSCDVVITCLPSPAASAAVLEQMLPHVGPGKVWLEMSTTDEAEVKRIGAQVIELGGAAVDCPVSGGCHVRPGSALADHDGPPGFAHRRSGQRLDPQGFDELSGDRKSGQRCRGADRCQGRGHGSGCCL
jgi:6-phosphogluconate dehydrogenase (decarboxylating)